MITILHAYDEKGRFIASAVEGEAAAYVLTFRSDSVGHVESITDQNGHRTSYTYDGTNVTSVTNGNGDTMNKTYDEDNNLTGIVDYDGGVTTMTYDECGNIEHQILNKKITVNVGTILFKNGISIHIAEDGFVKTVIGKAKVKSTWEAMNQ